MPYCAPTKAALLARGIDALDLEIYRILKAEGVTIRLPSDIDLITWTDQQVTRWRIRLIETWQQSAGEMPDWLRDDDEPVDPDNQPAILLDLSHISVSV